jgi:hypothetical protein
MKPMRALAARDLGSRKRRVEDFDANMVGVER